MMTKALFTGGRDRHTTHKVLNTLALTHKITEIVHGDARGINMDVENWAKQRRLTRHVYPADWDQYGAAAGPVRNAQMLKEEPDIVIAFPGGRGTADMIERAEENGIKVIRV